MDKYSFSVACDEAENDFYRVALVSKFKKELYCRRGYRYRFVLVKTKIDR